MIVVVMGVAGSGKSTVGTMLADAMHCPFLDGDSLHSAANVGKMLRGIPLTDANRAPWLAALHARLLEAFRSGIPINITLLFSIASYEAVAEAYLRALERRVGAGRSVDDVASVASFFLSRIDVLVDQLLGHRIRPSVSTGPGPRPVQLFGRAAIANAKLAYQRIMASDRWKALEARGARVQRLLWASTSTKDPLYGDVRYVEPLIGPHTVDTGAASLFPADAGV